ncbi:MAG: hypothetical protein QW348_08455 [Ignisphaera sp.]
MSTVISVRVPKWVKEKLDRYGIDVAELVRKKLLEEVERIELEEIEKQLDVLRERLKNKIDPYELVRIVDEERWERR